MTSLRIEFIKSLIELDDPLPSIWHILRNVIWSPDDGQSISDYYWQGEQGTNEFEKALDAIYGEIYTELIPARCLHADKNYDPNVTNLFIMDGLSLRETGLLVPLLEEQDFEVQESFGTSAIPSETIPFRQKIGYDNLKKQFESGEIAVLDAKLNGGERVVWCRFPDAIYENIQAGKTKIASIEEMFTKTQQALINALSQLESPILVTSDHGYIRTEAGCTFGVAEPARKRLRESLGGSRYQTMGEEDLTELVDQGALIEYDGKYLARARTAWPVQGKYSVFNHGGVSLMECITPRLMVTRK